MDRNADSGYGATIANGNVLPVYTRYDPLYREIRDQQPHQVRP